MTSRIFGHPPMVVADSHQMNVVFQNGEKMVSLSLDDSCGRMHMLGRGSIELHRRPKDGSLRVVTEEVFCAVNDYNNSDQIWNSLENFNRAMQWLNRSEFGFQAQSTSSFQHSER